jgi:hypothetical protein
VFTIPADLLTDQNIIAVGDIVILRDVTSGSETTAVESSVRQHATVTVPTPHVVIGGSRGMIHGSTKLHVLTYRGGSGTTAHNDRSGDLPNTCLPCAYDYTTARKGIISIRAWHFTGSVRWSVFSIINMTFNW